MQFSEVILQWYAEHGRALPWRESADPYKIWVSEIILQQTRVAQGMDYYRRFVRAFPTVEALADQMAKLYKPHRDKQNISSQLDSIGYDLKEIREDADKSDAQTKTEIEWQIRRMLLLGLSCLQLGGSISLSPTVAEPTVGQAISY